MGPDLILSTRDGYINSSLNPLTKFTSSSRSTDFKDILPWNISQLITKTIPISTRIVISNAMKRGIPLWIWWEVIRNWDNNMIRISQWRKAFVEQILASEEINKSTKTGVWESVWDPRRKVNHLSKVIWDRRIVTEFTRSISSTRIGKPILMMGIYFSKDKHICRWVDKKKKTKKVIDGG